MIRLLIIDESSSNRLALELCKRGRPALSLKQLGFVGFKDSPLIDAVGRAHPDAVLVTGDDRMPWAWAAELAARGLTVATIDAVGCPRWLTTDQWRRDVTHRWAHQMQSQAAGTIRRYGEMNRRWTKRRRWVAVPSR